MTSGTVVGGKIVIDGDPLPEGSTVTVLAAETEQAFDLSAADEDELLLRIEEANSGRTISAGEMRRRLASRR